MGPTVALLGVVGLAMSFPLNIAGQNSEAQEVTFSKDVAPIFYEKCVYCHRQGEIAPMSLLTHREARPWARGIKQEVLQLRMPPWRADPHYAEFMNDRSLTPREIQTIVAWVDGGAREGDPSDMPSPPQFADGWQIGTPDLVLTMKEPYTIPSTGTIPWITLESNDYVFPEDTWIQAIEIRPGNRRVVHHATANVQRPAGSDGGCAGSSSLHLYSPGLDAMIWREGYGKRICKGTRIAFGMHYNTIGTEQTDQTRVGLIFAKAPVHTEVKTTIVSNTEMLVPPLMRNHEVVSAYQFSNDARIYALRPHMHIRGKTGSGTAIAPDGRRRILLHVPDWDDAWQNYYMLSEPATMTKGSILEWVANFDNSPANPLNPDPTTPVRWGQQVWEEMHSVYMTWIEVNDENAADLSPINIPVNKAFTTGIMSER